MPRERAPNYRYPGHEITALSLWKRQLSRRVACQSTPTSTYYSPLLSVSSRPVPSIPLLTRRFPSISLAPSWKPGFEIMLPEISIKRGDSARAGIRLNLSSYSPRGRKEETFRTEERLAQGFDLRSMPIPGDLLILSSKSPSPLSYSLSLSHVHFPF